jgi:hypothetical protein
MDALWRETVGEPYAGNPHVRFDEGAADELKPCAWSAVVACDETFGALDPLLISALLYCNHSVCAEVVQDLQDAGSLRVLHGVPNSLPKVGGDPTPEVTGVGEKIASLG